MEAATGRLTSATLAEVRSSLAQVEVIRCVRLEGGGQVTCTGNHQVPLARHRRLGSAASGKAVLPAEDLCSGDHVWTFELCRRSVVSVDRFSNGIEAEDSEDASALEEDMPVAAERQCVSTQVLSLELERAGLFIFASDSASGEAVAVTPGSVLPRSMLQLTSPPSGPLSRLPSSPTEFGGGANSSISLSSLLSRSSISEVSVAGSSAETVVQVGAGKGTPMLHLSTILEIPMEQSKFISHGARLHPHACTPCPWQVRPRGCLDGILCPFCHHPSHSGLSYARRKQRHREMLQEHCGLVLPRPQDDSSVPDINDVMCDGLVRNMHKAQLPSLDEILAGQTLTAKRTFLNIMPTVQDHSPLRRTNSEPMLAL